jgi:transposase-like protein
MTREIVHDGEELGKAVEASDLESKLRAAMQRVVEQVMESEVTELLGAEPWERNDERRGYRNGHRSREWDTRLGRVSLQIPKLREGGYLPSFLEPRRRAERALVSVVQEAYVHGVSTRKVDDLVRALGASVSKSAVSRICQELDEEGRAFRERAIEVETPYVWLDALYEKARDGGHVRSTAVVVAIGVTAEGTRTVLGVDVGNTEDESFWKSFLRGLVRRGMKGAQLVISDAHTGLQKAIRQVLQGSSWQRCRVHTLRNILSHVPRGQQAMVAATVRTIFAQPSQAEAR